MDTVDEVSLPKSNDSTSLPERLGEVVRSCAPPVPTVVLKWIVESAEQPWFPSQHATTTGTDRDALDEPLTQLRVAGLIRIATWVRGIGQGYVATPEGEKAHATGTGIPPNAVPADPVSKGFPEANHESSLSADQRSQAVPFDEYAAIPVDPRPPVMVTALWIANALWFFVGLVAVMRLGHPFLKYLLSGDIAIAHRFGSVGGIDLLRGEWWRLLTSCFVHGGLIHLVANLIALAMIGPLAEFVWGRFRFGVIYLLSGLAGSCLAMALRPEASVVGASGAICGVLMSVFGWFLVFRTQLPPDVVLDMSRRFTLCIILNVMVSFAPEVSWQSHLGGAVAGFVAAGLFHAMRMGDLNRRRIALGLLLGLPVLSVGGLIVVMGRSQDWIDYRARIAQEQMARAAEAASKSFNQDVNTLLAQLNPSSDSADQPAVVLRVIRHGVVVHLPPVSPLLEAAVMQLLRPQSRRDASKVAGIKAALAGKKRLADRAIELLASPPVGAESIDRLREPAKEFAQAQSRSYGLLLEMLEKDAIPDEAAWTAWGKAKRNAEGLWSELLSQSQ